MKSIAIIGGGISGLTMAHELTKFGKYNITIYEKNDIVGGKVRSYPTENSYGEHSLHGYFGIYKSLYQTMNEIKTDTGTAMNNLHASNFLFQTAKGGEFINSYHTLSYFTNFIKLFRLNNISYKEILFFFSKISAVGFKSDKRLEATLGKIAFQDYIAPQWVSQQYRDIITSLAEIVVAAKKTSRADIIAKMLYKFSMTRLTAGSRRDSVPNGPASEMWLDPWKKQLEEVGVKFVFNTVVTGMIDGKLTTMSDLIEADDYVFAIPFPILLAILGDKLPASLQPLRNFKTQLSNGIQLFLSEIPTLYKLFLKNGPFLIGSPWSLVFGITTWKERNIITIAFSNDTTAGYNGKTILQCTADEIKDEVIVQIEKFFPGLKEVVTGYSLSHDISYLTDYNKTQYQGYQVSEVDGMFFLNDASLFISEAGQPRGVPFETEIAGVWSIGEHTISDFPVPTMERVNNSAKRCAEVILKRDGFNYDKGRYELSHDILYWIRWLDDKCYRS